MKLTVDIEELSALISKTPGTIRAYMRRHPERLPPFFRIEGTATPLWMRDVVIAFIERHARLCHATLTNRGSDEPGAEQTQTGTAFGTVQASAQMKKRRRTSGSSSGNAL